LWAGGINSHFCCLSGSFCQSGWAGIFFFSLLGWLSHQSVDESCALIGTSILGARCFRIAKHPADAPLGKPHLYLVASLGEGPGDKSRDKDQGDKHTVAYTLIKSASSVRMAYDVGRVAARFSMAPWLNTTLVNAELRRFFLFNMAQFTSLGRITPAAKGACNLLCLDNGRFWANKEQGEETRRRPGG
jgi:hypothetical protein